MRAALAKALPQRAKRRPGLRGGRPRRMSGDYSQISTADDDDEARRLAASPASANGKPLLKQARTKQGFKELAKEDFWSNINFLCCGGYKRELDELRRERQAFSGVRRRKPASREETRALPYGRSTHSQSSVDYRPCVACRHRQPRLLQIGSIALAPPFPELSQPVAGQAWNRLFGSLRAVS